MISLSTILGCQLTGSFQVEHGAPAPEMPSEDGFEDSNGGCQLADLEYLESSSHAWHPGLHYEVFCPSSAI